MVVWQPAIAKDVAPGMIALAPLSGSSRLVGPLTDAIVSAKPQQGSDLLTPESLLKQSDIQLASFNEGDSSDLVALSAARRQGAKNLLWGEVLSQPEPSSNKIQTPLLADGRLAIAWRLMDVATGTTVASHTVSVTAPEAIATYPDLIALQTNEIDVLNAAAARHSWRLVEPYLEPRRAVLVLPWISPGAEQIRRGNAYAHQGRWQEAELEWEEALNKHPRSHQALHNLAMAAVAKQDFDEARSRILQAMKLHRSGSYQESFAWIETQRRAYHDAFHLPDPEDGWPLGAR